MTSAIEMGEHLLIDVDDDGDDEGDDDSESWVARYNKGEKEVG